MERSNYQGKNRRPKTMPEEWGKRKLLSDRDIGIDKLRIKILRDGMQSGETARLAGIQWNEVAALYDAGMRG